MKNETNFNVFEFIVGALCVIAVFFALSIEFNGYRVLMLFFSAVTFLKGVYKIYYYVKRKTLPSYTRSFLLAGGIFNILLGAFFALNFGVSILSINYLFALWFVIESVIGLVNWEFTRHVGKAYFWFNIVINLIGIGLGAALFLNPFSVSRLPSALVGVYFMLFALESFILAFQGMDDVENL